MKRAQKHQSTLGTSPGKATRMRAGLLMLMLFGLVGLGMLLRTFAAPGVDPQNDIVSDPAAIRVPSGDVDGDGRVCDSDIFTVHIHQINSGQESLKAIAEPLDEYTPEDVNELFRQYRTDKGIPPFGTPPGVCG